MVPSSGFFDRSWQEYPSNVWMAVSLVTVAVGVKAEVAVKMMMGVMVGSGVTDG